MNEQPPSPVRLPASRIPEGTAPWRSADARRWLAAVPGRWAHPVWPALVLVGAVVWALLAVATPPRPDWAHSDLYRDFARPGSSASASASAPPSGSASAPASASASAPVAVPDLMRRLGPTPSDPGLPRAGGTDLTDRTTYSISVVSVTTSGSASDFDAWWLPTALLGLLLLELYWIWRRPALALAVLTPLTLAGLFFDDVLEDAVLPARIGVLTAAVLVAFHLAHRLAFRVRQRAQAVEAAGQERHPLPPLPARRPRGPLVLLLAGALLLAVAALACARADEAGGKWIVLLTGTLGTALLVHGVAARWQTRRRFRPQPALRVLVRESDDGKVWVYAADDREAAEPLLGFRSWGTYEGEAPAGAGGPADARPLREAVLYGTPATGAELAYVAAVDGPEGRVAVERGTTRAALAARGRPARRTPFTARDTGRRAHTENGTPVDPAEPTPTSPTTAPTHLSWSAGPVSRTAGVLALLFEAAAVWSFFGDERTLRSWLMLLMLPFALTWLATALNWRVTADRSGLWVAGGWRVKQLPWAEIEKVEYADDSLVFRGPDGARTSVRPTGWARLDRRTAKGHVAGRAAEEIRTMLADPELRPTEHSTPADQGMPLGPVIVLVAVLALAAVVLL
ncbi:hypothetical protein ACH4SP_12690 [Streptomyces sp. NPDC021093]|uniref:hypothetical protein n=1 Tax=Streptomyces sp. NPDC021093 TaxID=3365112 RepID=UPI0037AD19E1